MRLEVMSDSDDGRKIGDGKKGKTDPKSLPEDAIQLLKFKLHRTWMSCTNW